jgi:hypothetical protein
MVGKQPSWISSRRRRSDKQLTDVLKGFVFPFSLSVKAIILLP